MGSQALLLLLVLVVGTIHIASGTHFRGGFLSWKPAGSNSSSYAVDFKFRLAFRTSFSHSYYCDQNTVNSSGIIGKGGYWQARCTKSYCGVFNVGSVEYQCTDFSTSEDWSQGVNSFTAKFSYAGPWRISFTSCCWISLNFGGSSWYLSSTVNLTQRSDTGNINSSPISGSSPIVRLQQGCKKVIKIPTEDPDGDKVRCRWSVGSYECGGACQAFKYGRLDEEACTITFDGSGQNGWYAVALMLEDYPQSTVDFSAASPFSSVGLQFLVNIASNGGSCNRKPYFMGSTPAVRSCLEIRVGSTYRATIEVKHVDSARQVLEIHLVAPTGVARSAIRITRDRFGEIVYQRDVSWTPSSSQTGQHIVCFTALDNNGIQSDKRCLTILVGLDRHAPMALLSSRYPSYSTYYSGYGQYNTWSIRFDRPIKKPQKSSFIRIIVNGHVIFKVDTSVSNEVTVTGSNNTLLSFRTPSVVLSMRGTYSIVLDAGSVVGRGCSSDGPPTPGVTSQALWRVYTSGYCRNGYYRGGPFSACLDVNECVNPAGRYRRSLQAAAAESGGGSGRQKRWVRYASYAPSTTILPSPTPGSQILPTPVQISSSSIALSSAACYQHYTGYSGNISSPNYPSPYSANHDCIWNITLPYGYVRLQFYDFSLESCRYDYLDVIDGPTVGGQRLGHFCGRNLPPITYSKGRHLVLRFHSDGSAQYKGFRIYYSTVNSVPSSPSPTAQVSVAVTQVWPSPTQSGGECVTYRILSSADRAAGYDYRLYGRSPQCDNYQSRGWYRFTGNAGTQMPQSCVPQYRCGTHAPGWLNGQHPSVQEGVVSREVCFHWVSRCCYWNTTISVRNCSGFYVYNLSPPPVGCHLRFCGSNYVNVQASPTPVVPTQSAACYQHYTRYYGYISSPNYPSQYNANHDCIWNITLSSGYVRLQFYKFYLESCPYDYLDVIDGPTVGGQRLGRFCGRNLPPITYSIGRHLVLRFHSDGSVHHTGFRIYYSTVYSVPSSAVYINPTPTRPYITPTPIQSVAPNASAVYNSFVLHLPANCQHDCVNTAGSYYCRCHEGYKLNSDRKNCSDINECDINNGGCSHQCSNIPGSYYCACLQGQTISSDNKTCVEPGVEVTCNENYMQVHLDRVHFKSFDPSTLHLRYQDCRATANSTHISLRTSLNGCGTRYNETDDKLTFYNEVNVKKIIIKGLVTRSFEVHIPFYCEYSKSSIVHVSFKPFGIIKGYEGGYGNFTFRMDLFKTSAYRQRFGADDYPISVQLNELLYIQYSVESLQSSLVVFAHTCRATPSRDPYSRSQYIFLMNGCPEDTTMTFNYNQNPVQRFTIRAFKFLADYPVVYLHCRVMACHKNTVGSRCSRGCQRSIRKKRDLTSRETENPQPKETQTYDVPSGPIVLRKDKIKENSGFDRAQATLVGSVSGVGGVFLIIAIILAVIVVQKGYIKKFKRRNKVDDIYGREQATRTNTYVGEDDFAANEEDITARADEITTRDEGFVVREDVFVTGEDKFTESGC